MSTYTGIANYQKAVRFFGPPCKLLWYVSHYCYCCIK